MKLEAFMASKRLSFDIREHNLPLSTVRHEAQVKNLKRSSARLKSLRKTFWDLPPPRMRGWEMVQKS